MNSTAKLGETTCVLEELTRHIAECDEEEGSKFETRLVRHLLCLSAALQDQGLEAGRILYTAWELVKTKPQVAFSSFLSRAHRLKGG